MTPPKPNDRLAIIAKLNELYVTTRRKYIMQTTDAYREKAGTDAKYATFDKWALNDGTLKIHLDGKNTYGVFNANTTNKFITFDVDYADDMPAARWATMKLIDVLERDFNVRRDDMHVSISGDKGFHVDLFMDRMLPLETVQAFYRNVLIEADLPSNKVEFRPLWNVGVKLPLGIHQRTGNRCWFVDTETLEPIESFDYLNDVQPMNADVIIDGAIELSVEQAAEFAEIERRTDTTITLVDATKALQKAARIIEDGRLTTSNTRHATTLTLASFFNSQGLDKEDAISAIMAILHNTPREYFSKGSTSAHWQKETERLVGIAFSNNYTLGNVDKPVTIYKSEILAVLGVGTFRQKQVAYAMLITSKRYGAVFYLTMNTAMRMIGTKSKPTVNTAIKKLATVGFIEYAQKGKVDDAKSREVGHRFFKPNKYRLLIDKPAIDELSVEVTSEHSIVDVAYLLCDVREIQQRVKRTEFGNQWAQ